MGTASIIRVIATPTAAFVVAMAGLAGASTCVAAEIPDGESAGEAPTPALFFVGDAVTVYLRDDTVGPDDFPDDNPSVDEQQKRDSLMGKTKAFVSLSVKNAGGVDVAIADVSLTFRAVTKLGEPIATEIIRTSLPPELNAFPAHSVTTFRAQLLGLEAGWDGLVVLEPSPGAAPTFDPATLEFSVVNRNVSPWHVLWPVGAVALFVLIARPVRKQGAFRGWHGAVRNWGDKWSLKDNVLAVFAFATAALAALVGAGGDLDRLAGVDIGLFVGLNILLAGLAGSTALLVRVAQVEEDGALKPRVLVFWIGIAVSVLAATGIITATGLLVFSMTFTIQLWKWLIVIGLALTWSAMVAFAAQIVRHQSTSAETMTPDMQRIDEALDAAAATFVNAAPFRDALEAAVAKLSAPPGPSDS